MRRVRINCAQEDWRSRLEKAVADGNNAELVNFDYASNGKVCEILVMNRALHLVSDPQSHAGLLKRL